MGVMSLQSGEPQGLPAPPGPERPGTGPSGEPGRTDTVISDLWNYDRTHSYCLKPSCLWHFVIAATGDAYNLDHILFFLLQSDPQDRARQEAHRERHALPVPPRGGRGRDEGAWDVAGRHPRGHPSSSRDTPPKVTCFPGPGQGAAVPDGTTLGYRPLAHPVSTQCPKREHLL